MEFSQAPLTGLIESRKMASWVIIGREDCAVVAALRDRNASRFSSPPSSVMGGKQRQQVNEWAGGRPFVCIAVIVVFVVKRSDCSSSLLTDEIEKVVTHNTLMSDYGFQFATWRGGC